MDLLQRATRLLTPLMGEDRRDTWLALAFHPQHRSVYHAIPQAGSALDFTVRCVRLLDARGCVGSQHALALLLEAVRGHAGDEQQAEFQALIDELEGRCKESVPTEPVPASVAPSPMLSKLQPGDVRSRADTAPPLVFVSYARADKPFADRLVADLDAAGLNCWLDTSDVPGGAVWVNDTADAIERAYAIVSIVTPAANRSDWVRLEFLHARKSGKPVIPVLGPDGALPWYMADRQAISLQCDYADGLQRLIAALPAPPAPNKGSEIGAQRAAELAYLRRLQMGELIHTELYTPMAGVAQIAARGLRMPTVVMRPEFQHLRRLAESAVEPRSRQQSYDDIVAAFRAIKRAVLLGEPGAGKTTTLWKIARDALEAALVDPAAPVPLLARLGEWTDPSQPIQAFIASQLGELGAYLGTLLETRRCVLLLDGLNEVPAAERGAKAVQIKTLLHGDEARLAPVMVTCRALDYAGALDLDLDTLTIRPLDAPRILEFLTHYLSAAVDPAETDTVRREALGRERAEALFWRLAGGHGVREVWELWRRAGADLQLFWSAAEVPREKPNVYRLTSAAQDETWRQAVHGAHSLMRLAGNPYMLFMLTQVYLASGEVPANRAVLFDGFVQVLLLREHLAEDDGSGIHIRDEGLRVLAALERLAWTMQSHRSAIETAGQADEADALTSIDRGQAESVLGANSLHRAASASLLSVGEREVGFVHQLLQEYFTACGMRARLDKGELNAAQFWPADRWWQRSGWDEAAVLLAGFYAEDCAPVIQWLADAQPEVAAQCIAKSGAKTTREALARLREKWIPRLTDLAGDPAPEARAAVGRALGSVRIDGQPLDNRRGVGLRLDSSRARWVPDIDWLEVPGGPFHYQDEKRRRTLPSFYISRYPVTHAQFQAFVEASDGYPDARWWTGLAQPDERPPQPAWTFANHPRETVSWFEAVAFCRWLSDVLGYEVRLPTEQQWEKAARGMEGREYPWEGGFRSGHANINETWDSAGPHYVGQTTAVGVYPQGASPCGALDMAGNVWEWCMNKYAHRDDSSMEGHVPRAVRGGSWRLNRDSARCAFRSSRPGLRYDFIGFRLVCVSPIS